MHIKLLQYRLLFAALANLGYISDIIIIIIIILSYAQWAEILSLCHYTMQHATNWQSCIVDLCVHDFQVQFFRQLVHLSRVLTNLPTSSLAYSLLNEIFSSSNNNNNNKSRLLSATLGAG